MIVCRLGNARPAIIYYAGLILTTNPSWLAINISLIVILAGSYINVRDCWPIQLDINQVSFRSFPTLDLPDCPFLKVSIQEKEWW